jgi:Ca2+-binding RTX toxin-like protein
MPFEPLEGRRLCAAAALQNHTLVVTATAGVPNTITVGLSADGSSIDATVSYVTGRGAKAKPHTFERSFPLSDGISTVVIYGSNKADDITIDSTYGTLPTLTEIHAGGGNDTVTCGDEPDVVWGQGGNDLIYGGGGNDTLYGMAGSDSLIGGAGDDYLAGGTGRDSLAGDDGNDTLYDPYGPDTVLGGAGNNTFDIASLRKDVDNDFNNTVDTLHTVLPPKSSSSDDSVGDIIGQILPFL